MDAYLTAKEVALLLKLSVHTIRRYTMNKEIPYHKVNRAVRFKKTEIELWFEERKAAVAKASNSKPDTTYPDGGLFGEAETVGLEVCETEGGNTADCGGTV